MGMDVDYIAADQAIDRLSELLSSYPHGKREEIADDIIEMVEIIEKKWKK